MREALQGRRARLEGKVDFAGRAAHFQAHLIPDRSDGGVQRGYYLMTFDITALKEAETRRAKVEGQLRAITDNLPVAITYLDAEQRYRFVNRTGLEWLCRPAGEVIGQRIGDILRPVAYERRRENIEAGLTGKRVTFEAESITGDVTRILHYAYIPDIESDGRVAGLYGLATDVSALKKVERQLSLLVRSDVLTGLANRYHVQRGDAAGAVARTPGDVRPRADVPGHRPLQEHQRQPRPCRRRRGAEGVRAAAAAERAHHRHRGAPGRRRVRDHPRGRQHDEEPQVVARKIVANVAGRWRSKAATLTTRPPASASRSAARSSSADAATVEALIGRADAALYAAKNAGRNTWRVMVNDVLVAEKGIA